MWRHDRSKNRDTEEAVRPDSARKGTEAGAQTLGRDVVNVLVVGPPGCCGRVSKSVRSRSQRKKDQTPTQNVPPA